MLRTSRPGYLLADLEAAGLRSRRELRAGAEFALPAFLEALRAPAWRGERWLEAPEGELYLSATKKNAGDVDLVVQLRNKHALEPWQVEASIRLPESDLGQLADRARDLLSALVQEVGGPTS